MNTSRTHRAAVIGGSAGGLEALGALVVALGEGCPLVLVAVLHVHRTSSVALVAQSLSARGSIVVSEARDKEQARPGQLYLAPPDYHLLIERDGGLALSVDAKVRWARPSIDVLFESAARAFGKELIGVILSGANDDGSDGMAAIKRFGGLTLAQDPASALHAMMPLSAIERGVVERVAPIEGIAAILRARSGATEVER
ncbi:MAG: chemotaxis protein CheB [Myxococcales bacterium]|nr:chemotaxis protein CheB [Myxococcales bacterium]